MEKILQIIPAPVGLVGHLLKEDGRTTTAVPVVAIALVEDKTEGQPTSRHAEYMVAYEDGEIERTGEIGNFVGVQFIAQ